MGADAAPSGVMIVMPQRTAGGGVTLASAEPPGETWNRPEK